MKNYDDYQFSMWEYVIYGGGYAALGLAVSWLFYHSLWPLPFLLAGLPFFLKQQKRKRIRKQKEELLKQFLYSIRTVANGLNAGYAVENAMKLAWVETEKVYGKDGMMVQELEGIVCKMKLNDPLEALLLDFGKRSHQEDIENFSEIFSVARRSGGDLKRIIQNTAENISQKAGVQEEIEVSLAAKKKEQQVMSLIPLLILLYVDVTSPEFLDGLYHNTFGVGVMTVCLMIYALAFFWGRRIVQIEV